MTDEECQELAEKLGEAMGVLKPTVHETSTELAFAVTELDRPARKALVAMARELLRLQRKAKGRGEA